ncbi:secreted glucosidase [Apiospora marii]|uniref:Secreted glucosidase n=1 Tax=Apiospora marii TaxID=335849 RepID=A0ABR1S9H9_9PEZI
MVTANLYTDDDFRIDRQLPYRKWDAIVGGTKVNNEIQRYDSAYDVTHIRTILGGPAPHRGDSMFITPQYKDGEWRSARMEGKEAYSCPEGKSLILQAEIQVGTAPSDQQAGIWPAFWAMGQSCQRKDGKEEVPWPECGEWDILETSDGHDWTLGSIHWGVKNADGKVGKKDWPTAFGDEQVAKYGNKYDHTQSHTWAIKVDRTKSNWKDETIQWLMDGNQFFEMKGSDVNDEGQWAVLAHEPYFPILNVAVGGNFPQTQPVNDKTGTGTDTGMQVQYVAFYISD